LDDQLQIAVEDNGLGLDASTDNSGSGVGLANVKRRLQLCFGPDADILIDSSSDGTKVQFAIPLAKPVPELAG
jgi:two-component system LytT family sensor kinase/two-component system sensor histidine kinase LytS